MGGRAHSNSMPSFSESESPRGATPLRGIIFKREAMWCAASNVMMPGEFERIFKALEITLVMCQISSTFLIRVSDVKQSNTRHICQFFR